MRLWDTIYCWQISFFSPNIGTCRQWFEIFIILATFSYVYTFCAPIKVHIYIYIYIILIPELTSIRAFIALHILYHKCDKNELCILASGILVFQYRQFLLHDRIADLSADYSFYHRFWKKSHFGSSCDLDDLRRWCDSSYSINKSYCYMSSNVSQNRWRHN